MVESLAPRASPGHRTLCLPFAAEAYLPIIHDPAEFRRAIDDRFRTTPELFPAHFADGSRLKDHRVSAKPHVPIRRVILKGNRSRGSPLAPGGLSW